MDNIILSRRWVQGTPVTIDNLTGTAFTGEAQAHTFRISGVDAAGADVQITGTVTGAFLAPNNTTIPLTGTLTDGVAEVTLTSQCYELPGRFILSVYAANGDTNLCIYCGVGYVFCTETDQVAYPSAAIPDISQLIQEAQDVIDSIPEDYSALSAHFPATGKFVVGTNTSATEENAVAEGEDTIASGLSSHAEGYASEASGDYSHSEGGSIASGGYSHAEGSASEASGENAHAEGLETTASGDNSHSEGWGTTSSGMNAHAEGVDTVASGNMSHSEGEGTIANHAAQSVSGTYNVADPSQAAATAKGNYAEIVGNGTADNARSNARTLDWSGNEELAGDLTINKNGANEMTVGEELSDLKSAVSSQDGIVNVTKLVPLQSGYYTLSTAITAVYSFTSLITKGRIITFATSASNWETWQCIILDNQITENAWKTVKNWIKINKTSKESIVLAAYDSSDSAKQNADIYTNVENDGIKIINDAITLLTNGGKIYLRKGTYKGAVGVSLSNNNIVIEGETPDTTIQRTSGNSIIGSSGNNATLINLTTPSVHENGGVFGYQNCTVGTVSRTKSGTDYDLYFAAYDSTDLAKRAADYVCSNTSVNTMFADALSKLPNGGTIKFAAGTYNLTSVLDLNGKTNITLVGDGYNTKIVRDSNPLRANDATTNCILQGINFSTNPTFGAANGKVLNCWYGNKYIDLFPKTSGEIYVDPVDGIDGINNAIASFGAGTSGGKIVLGIGSYENVSGTSSVQFYRNPSPSGYVSNVTIEGQGIKTVISRSTNNNDVVTNSSSISGCVLKNVNVAHNVQRTVGNPVSMLRLIGCYIGGKYVDESSEGSINVVNVGVGRYFDTLSAAYNMFYTNSYPISETERWEIHIWGYVLETTPLNISKNRIDLIGHNALIEMRGKGEVRASFGDQNSDYYGPGLEISVRDIHFKKTGCYNYYQNYAVYVSSDNVKFYNCVFENASSSPTPFDQRNYLESQEATAGARRHGIGIECKKWGAQCKTEFHDCIGIGSPYGFMNTRGWYIVFGSPKLFNCVGYGGGIGEFCHGIINHRSSQAELIGCIGYASKTAFRKSAGIRFQAAGSSQLTGCKGYGSGGTKYISEGVSAERVTEICTELGLNPSTYVVDGVVQYSSLTDAICAEISNDDITLTPLNANTEEGYGISFWANDGTAKLMNCEGYAGSGDNSHGLHIIAQAEPTINGGYYGIKDMLQNINVVSNSGNDMVTAIGGELNDYSKYTVSQITVSVIGGAVSTADLLYVETTEDTPQTIVNGFNLKNISSIAVVTTERTTVTAGKKLKIYIKRNDSKIEIASGKYIMHVQYNYAGDDSSAVYIDNGADPLIANAIIRADDGSDAVEVGSSYTGSAVRMYDCALHGSVDAGVVFAAKTAVNSSSNFVI